MSCVLEPLGRFTYHPTLLPWTPNRPIFKNHVFYRVLGPKTLKTRLPRGGAPCVETGKPSYFMRVCTSIHTNIHNNYTIHKLDEKSSKTVSSLEDSH